MEDTLAQALDRACADLNRTAVELGAESAAVLLNADNRIEVTWFWSEAGFEAPERQFTVLQRSRYESLNPGDGAIDAGGLTAQFFQDTISRRAQSFLLHRWYANRQAVAIVLGFAEPLARARRVPDAAVESLNLAALATWSEREITRLRAELKTANGRLAGRKLVERAKGVLQVERGISEESAYAYMRGQSRKRRITLTKLAEEVVRVHGGLDSLTKRRIL